MKPNSLPVKIFFGIRRVQIRQVQAGWLRICIQLSDKAVGVVASKDYQFLPNAQEVTINEKLEVNTKVEQENGEYKRKVAMMQVYFRMQDGSTDCAYGEMQLTEFVGTEVVARSLRLRGNTHQAQIDFQCKSSFPNPAQPQPTPLQQFKSLANLQTNVPQFTSKADLGGQKSTKQLGLQVRKKQRTLLNIPNQNISPPILKSSLAIEPPSEFKRNPKKCHTNVQLGTARVVQFNYSDHQQSDKPDKRSKHAVPSIKSIKQVSASSHNKPRSSTSLEGIIQERNDEDKEVIRKLNDEIGRWEKNGKKMEEENKRLTRQVKELQEKVKLLESSEQNSEDTQKKIVKRLYQDIDSKNRQIKELELEVSKQKEYLQKQQELTLTARRELKQALIQKDRVILDTKLKSTTAFPKDNSKSLHRQMQQMKKDYEQKIKELKTENMRLLAFNEVQSSKINQSDLCLSKQCQKDKRQLRSKIKQIQKALQMKEPQLQTKQRLIKNYEDVKKDRQNENTSIDTNKLMQKWRGERLLLEQQIQELKCTKSQKGRGQDEILTLKIEKQTLAREMQRLKRTLNQVTKDKDIFENNSNKLQDELINTKQKVVDLLNGIHQYGGLQLYDTICSIIQ